MSVRLRQGGKRTKRRRPQGHSAAASSGGAELQRSVANTHSRTRQGKPNTGGKGEERAASGGDVCALLESCHTRHAEESELSGSPRADLMSTCHPSDDDANVFDRRYLAMVSERGGVNVAVMRSLVLQYHSLEIVHVCALAHCVNLEHCDLSHNHIHTLTAVAGSAPAPMLNLRSVSLANNCIERVSDVLQLLEASPLIETFDVRGNGIDSAHLITSPHLSHVHTFNGEPVLDSDSMSLGWCSSDNESSVQGALNTTKRHDAGNHLYRAVSVHPGIAQEGVGGEESGDDVHMCLDILNAAGTQAVAHAQAQTRSHAWTHRSALRKRISDVYKLYSDSSDSSDEGDSVSAASSQERHNRDAFAEETDQIDRSPTAQGEDMVEQVRERANELNPRNAMVGSGGMLRASCEAQVSQLLPSEPANSEAELEDERFTAAASLADAQEYRESVPDDVECDRDSTRECAREVIAELMAAVEKQLVPPLTHTPLVVPPSSSHELELQGNSAEEEYGDLYIQSPLRTARRCGDVEGAEEKEDEVAHVPEVVIRTEDMLEAQESLVDARAIVAMAEAANASAHGSGHSATESIDVIALRDECTMLRRQNRELRSILENLYATQHSWGWGQDSVNTERAEGLAEAVFTMRKTHESFLHSHVELARSVAALRKAREDDRVAHERRVAELEDENWSLRIELEGTGTGLVTPQPHTTVPVPTQHALSARGARRGLGR